MGRSRPIALLVLAIFFALAFVGIVFTRSPDARVAYLRSSQRALVESSQEIGSGWSRSSLQVTTDGGLEFPVVWIHPSATRPHRLLLVGAEDYPLEELDPSSVSRFAWAWVGPPTIAGCGEAEGWFTAREFTDRRAAALLAALDVLRDRGSYGNDVVDIVSVGPWASAASISARHLASGRRPLLVEPGPATPDGLGHRLRHHLGHGGSRSWRASAPRIVGASMPSGALPIPALLQEIEASPAVGLQPAGR